MGTRGLWGLRHKNNDYLTYNHFDSYPSGLGNIMVATIHNYSDETMKSVAEEIQLVDQEDKPCEEAVKQMKKIMGNEEEIKKILMDKGIPEDEVDQTIEMREYTVEGIDKAQSYYSLLRITQGDPDSYFSRGLRYMTDDREFMFDSIFCEWAYIINLDTKMLEVYKGFNKDYKNQRLPYVKTEKDEYYACAPLVDIPFEKIRQSDEWLPELIKQITGKEVD